MEIQVKETSVRLGTIPKGGCFVFPGSARTNVFMAIHDKSVPGELPQNRTVVCLAEGALERYSRSCSVVPVDTTLTVN